MGEYLINFEAAAETIISFLANSSTVGLSSERMTKSKL